MFQSQFGGSRMFWTTVTSHTSSEKRRTNRHTVKPTVMFGSRAGFAKGSRSLPCFHSTAYGSPGACFFWGIFVFRVLGVGAEWRSVPFLCLTFNHLSRSMFEVATCG